MTTTIVDYGCGNLFSLVQAFRHIGEDSCQTSDPKEIETAERLVLPGVGAFKDGMDGLRHRKLVNAVRSAADGGKPLLGVCLGMQLLADEGEEFGTQEGLGIISGRVTRIPESRGGSDLVRIPNVGWRKLQVRQSAHFLPQDIGMVYFAHSYFLSVDHPRDVAATTRINGFDMTVSVRCNNVFGCQFHPEKSGEPGLAILRRFLEETTL